MSSAGLDGCEVLLQSEGEERCAGYAGVGLSRPARILVRTGEAQAGRFSASLAIELDWVLATVGTRLESARLPCHASLQRPCRAIGEAQTLNLLVWVGSEDEPDAGEEEAVSSWLSARPDAAAVAVLPDAADPDRALPPSLRRLNVIRWRGSESVARDVLDAVDADSLERRAFVSYSHADGAAIAHAVARVLIGARFSVFLDAISLRPGVDFAERIEHELSDKSFLVLIETPKALRSEWVIRRELRFARLNRLGIAAVRPGDSAAPRVAGIGPRRWALPDGAVSEGGGGGPALRTADADALCDFLVARHDEAMLRRRRVVEEGLRLMLAEEGVTGVSGVAGGLRVDAAGKRWHVGIRPRPAALLEMRETDRLAAALDGGVMVSPTPAGAREREALAWLSDRSAIRRWDEGRLRSLARALGEGTP